MELDRHIRMWSHFIELMDIRKKALRQNEGPCEVTVSSDSSEETVFFDRDDSIIKL